MGVGHEVLRSRSSRRQRQNQIGLQKKLTGIWDISKKLDRRGEELKEEKGQAPRWEPAATEKWLGSEVPDDEVAERLWRIGMSNI